LIVIATLGVVIAIGKPAVESAKTVDTIRNMENVFDLFSNYIKAVNYEGKDSVREYSYFSSSGIEFDSRDDSVSTRIDVNKEMMEYLSRKDEGIIYIAGSDVSCYEEGNTLVIENSYLRVVFQKISGYYSTVNNIISITQKTDNFTIYPADSSIVIDDISATASGTGFSVISRTGRNLPVCRVQFFMNSTLDYDIFYKLYAGADFITTDVRNIR